MDTLSLLRRELEESSDPDNPPAEELRALFERVRTVAVIGLSRSPAKAARRVPSYLAAKGYDVIPVNPRADRLLGRAARDRLEEVDEPVDLVVVFRPSEEAGAFVESAAARPERPAIWLQSGIRSDREAEAARAQGLLVVQDLCTFRVHRSLSG